MKVGWKVKDIKIKVTIVLKHIFSNDVLKIDQIKEKIFFRTCS